MATFGQRISPDISITGCSKFKPFYKALVFRPVKGRQSCAIRCLLKCHLKKSKIRNRKFLGKKIEYSRFNFYLVMALF